MAGGEQLRALLTELGPVLDLAEIYQKADANTWTLAAQDGTILFLELVPEDDRLWLSAEAGAPRDEDRARLYSLMLQYNAQWQTTGGARLALDAPDGAVVLACDVPASGLDLPRLCAAVGNFRDMLDGWRAIVAGQRAAGSSSGHQPAAAAGIRG